MNFDSWSEFKWPDGGLLADMYADWAADREEQAKVYAAGMAEAESQIDRLIGEKEKLVGALRFYADPETYFAIGFFPDEPCGLFADDFSETGLSFKPGKKARAILSELDERKEEE